VLLLRPPPPPHPLHRAVCKGTPYQRGYAQGLLQTKQVQQVMNDTWNYFVTEVVSAVNGTGESPH